MNNTPSVSVNDTRADLDNTTLPAAQNEPAVVKFDSSLARKIRRELLHPDKLIAQAKDYLAIADQENLDPTQKDRLRRAASAMLVCASAP